MKLLIEKQRNKLRVKYDSLADVYINMCTVISTRNVTFERCITFCSYIVKVFGDRSALSFCDMVGYCALLLVVLLVAVTDVRFPFISVRSACRIVVRRRRRRVVAVRVMTDVRGGSWRMRFRRRRRFVRVW